MLVVDDVDLVDIARVVRIDLACTGLEIGGLGRRPVGVEAGLLGSELLAASAGGTLLGLGGATVGLELDGAGLLAVLGGLDAALLELGLPASPGDDDGDDQDDEHGGDDDCDGCFGGHAANVPRIGRREPAPYDARVAWRLSVVVPTTAPWPELQGCLDALLPQAEALGAEVIVADSDGHGVPDDLLRATPFLVHLHAPRGASVFDLRSLGVASATGDVVAITEDHCRPAPDWCARLVDAFASNPAALGVAGAVTNGTRDRLIDRANYFLTFAGAAPPVDRDSYGFPPVSNVSFRREAIPAGELAPGDLELRLGPDLLADGRMVVDDRVLVAHVQSHGFFGTFAMHFHNGRASTGLLTDGRPWPERRRRLRAQLRRPFRLTRATHRALRSKPEAMTEARPAFPFIALLAGCYSAGAVVGLVRGPGTSPARLA